MAGLLPRLVGVIVVTVPAPIRRRIGVLFDTPARFDDLTGWENAAFFAGAYGLPPEEAHDRLAALFQRFELTEQAHDVVNSYTYGMGRKLALVEALVWSAEAQGLLDLIPAFCGGESGAA